jgi:hypothetical protein
VNARGGFWYCTYQGGLNAESFVELLRRMMRRRSPMPKGLGGLSLTDWSYGGIYLRLRFNAFSAQLTGKDFIPC